MSDIVSRWQRWLARPLFRLLVGVGLLLLWVVLEVFLMKGLGAGEGFQHSASIILISALLLGLGTFAIIKWATTSRVLLPRRLAAIAVSYDYISGVLKLPPHLQIVGVVDRPGTAGVKVLVTGPFVPEHPGTTDVGAPFLTLSYSVETITPVWHPGQSDQNQLYGIVRLAKIEGLDT